MAFIEPYGVVYLARNTINGKCYVGQTTQPPEARFNQHRRRVEVSHCRALSGAMKKYGSDAFEFIVLCVCFSKAAIDEAEIGLIDAYQAAAPNGYNLKTGGSFGKHSAEARAAISNGNKGKVRTPEHCERQRRRMLGQSPSPEARAKISASLTGKKLAPHLVARLVEINTGRVPSAESRRKMSTNRSGIPVAAATRAKIRDANIGKKHSAETRERMSESQRNRWAARRAGAQ